MATPNEATPERVQGYWSENPDYPVEDWKYEVQNNDTRQGYWDWVESQIEAAGLEDRDGEPQCYATTVTVTRLVPEAKLHSSDRDVPESHSDEVWAKSPEEARELALDRFHETVPVKVLDDFDFEASAELTPISYDSSPGR